MGRLIAVMLAVLAVTACTNPNDLDKDPVYLGNFNLAHNVVVAPNLTKGPASREASKEEWIEAMKTAIDDRFGRYKGSKLYHLGISIEGYVLAIPGVPVVASPKSALIINVTVWDDSTQSKLNEKPEMITVVETISGRTVLGSGLTQSKKKQMENLTRNAAKLIEKWLVQQNCEYGWFEDDRQPVPERCSFFEQDDKDDSGPSGGGAGGGDGPSGGDPAGGGDPGPGAGVEGRIAVDPAEGDPATQLPPVPAEE